MLVSRFFGKKNPIINRINVIGTKKPDYFRQGETPSHQNPQNGAEFDHQIGRSEPSARLGINAALLHGAPSCRHPRIRTRTARGPEPRCD
jgi:hypothetical protein